MNTIILFVEMMEEIETKTHKKLLWKMNHHNENIHCQSLSVKHARLQCAA